MLRRCEGSEMDRVEVVPVALSDYDGVRLHLRSPNHPIRVKTSPRVNSVPAYAKLLVDAAGHGALDDFQDWLEEASPTAAEAAKEWDRMKQRIATWRRNP
ncbi:hypothetical protein PC122_g17139 [Phytophthora cactorum]|nr:hypothetical protein PC122_g17139 [Phytophthora cactorum]